MNGITGHFHGWLPRFSMVIIYPYVFWSVYLSVTAHYAKCCRGRKWGVTSFSRSCTGPPLVFCWPTYLPPCWPQRGAKWARCWVTLQWPSGSHVSALLPLCCLSASLLLAGTLGVWGRKEGVCIDKRKWTNTLFIYASSSSSSSSSPIKGYCCHYSLEIEITFQSWLHHCFMLSLELWSKLKRTQMEILVVVSARKAHHPLRSLPDLHSQIHPDLAVWMTCLLKRNVFSHHWLNGIVAMWGFLCACVISLVMSHQIPISLCLKLIERKESFWSLLVDPPFLLSVPSPIHLSLFSCQLSLLQRDWLRLHNISQESGVPFPHWPN